MNIKIENNFDNISINDWNDLLSYSDNMTIFQTYEWNKCWWNTFGKDHNLTIIIASIDSQIVAIAPLYVHKTGSNKILKFIGTGRSDYLDFIYKNSKPEYIYEILNFIKINNQTWNYVSLDNISSSSSTNIFLKDFSSTPNNYIYCYSTKPCPFIKIDKDKHILQELSNKRHLINLKKQITKIGSLTIEHLQEFDQIKPYLDQFFTQHINRQAVINTQSLFLDETAKSFYNQITGSLSKTNNIIFSILKCQNKPVAFHFGFIYKNTLAYYKPTFDVNWHNYSPGQILLKEMFDYISDTDITTFDFGCGEEGYKTRFANSEKNISSFRMFKSKISLFIDKIKNSLKSIKLTNHIYTLFKNYGLVKSIKKLLIILSQFVFNVKGISLFKKKPLVEISSPSIANNSSIFLKEISMDELFQLNFFNTKEERISYLTPSFQRFKNNQLCIGLFDNQVLAAIAWVESSKSINISEVNKTIHLKNDSFIINNCLTVPAFRRKGYYKNILNYIIDIHESDDLYIYCKRENKASIKGIETFFKKTSTYYQIQLLGIKFTIKIKTNT